MSDIERILKETEDISCEKARAALATVQIYIEDNVPSWLWVNVIAQYKKHQDAPETQALELEAAIKACEHALLGKLQMNTKSREEMAVNFKSPLPEHRKARLRIVSNGAFSPLPAGMQSALQIANNYKQEEEKIHKNLSELENIRHFFGISIPNYTIPDIHPLFGGEQDTGYKGTQLSGPQNTTPPYRDDPAIIVLANLQR